MDEIVSLGKSKGLEVDEEDVNNLVKEHKEELTTQELIELQEMQHSEVLQELSIEEEVEDEGRLSTAEIKDTLAKWQDFSNFMEKEASRQAGDWLCRSRDEADAKSFVTQKSLKNTCLVSNCIASTRDHERVAHGCECQARDHARDHTGCDRARERAARDRARERAGRDRARERAACDRARERAACDRARERAASDRARDRARERAASDRARDRARERAARDRSRERAACDCAHEHAARDLECEARVLEHKCESCDRWRHVLDCERSARDREECLLEDERLDRDDLWSFWSKHVALE
ncbi:nuclear speckle splicing regulatory protein 1-like [Palaemon carinicauda]|uniref:nuclear speckle splicing regulatory protein 1-like n=1 Tax=Palaemon carinicauda TaxID=392227 RepID=UPI0035B6011D